MTGGPITAKDRAVLAMRKDKPMSVAEIASAANVSRPTVYAAINALVASGQAKRCLSVGRSPRYRLTVCRSQVPSYSKVRDWRGRNMRNYIQLSLDGGDWVKARDLADDLDVHQDTILKHLRILIQDGIVCVKSDSRNHASYRIAGGVALEDWGGPVLVARWASGAGAPFDAKEVASALGIKVCTAAKHLRAAARDGSIVQVGALCADRRQEYISAMMAHKWSNAA